MILTPEQNLGSFFNRQNRESRRTKWQEVYHFRPTEGWGQHLPRVRLNVSHINFSGIHSSHPVRIERSDGTLAEYIGFAGPTDVERDSTEVTLFFQDKWNPHPRLTLDYGVRYDRDSLGGDSNVAPRLGVALLLTSDNRTVLRGGVGLFYDKIPLNIGTFADLQSRRVSRFAADGLALRGPPLQFRNVLRPGDLDNPRSLAWNAELDRSLDLQVAKGMTIPFFGKKYKTRIGFKIFNLTNHFNPRDVQNNIDSSPVLFREEGSRFGQFCNSVGRIFRGKFIVEF